jgi:hypothetical protein
MDDSRPRSASPQPHRSDPNAPERCTRPDPPRAQWGREKVRAALGLAIWEIELAIETGLLRRLPDRDFEATAVEAALADPEAFRALLAAEHRLNAADAAGRLGISRQRFARVVKQAGLEPVAEEQVHRYRRLLTVRYYRAADVDTLQPYVGADIALREAATAVGRSDAAQKAARTRARNRERAREARLELDAARPDDEASPLRVLRYAAGLAAGRPEAPSFLRRFTDDPAVQRLATLVTDCRLRDAEHAQLATQVREQARVAFRAMAGPSEIRSRLGVEPRALTGHAEMIEWFAERRLLAAWETDPPGWLLTERAAQAAADAARAAHQARSLERQQVLEAAERATQLTDEAVAEIFGLPMDTIAQLRPRKRGHWSWRYVTQLRARPPAWLRNEASAREEVAGRIARRAAAKDRNARKRAAWRQTWAREMNMPVKRVPERCPKPTPAAIRAARANPPRWARS